MIYEMLLLQRASMDGLPSTSVVSSNITPTSPVTASRTDSWVNVLWFTSLALSLTTALMAVLTKQWIHQYMAVPSGTPRDRSRIRQFRFENIDKWHVPLIIGLLPVLMHVALGVFLFGLVIYVRALTTPGAILVGIIAFIAFVAYFGTTLLPIFKPDCPYKTYLTLYCYSISTYVRMIVHHSRFKTWISCRLRAVYKHCGHQPRRVPETNVPYVQTWLRSLRDVERRTVDNIARTLDARALIGLYNISSNTSVQNIVLQALSILPLELLPTIRAGIPDAHERIRNLVESMEFTAADKHTAYECLFRAHIRVEAPAARFARPDVFTPTLTRVVRPPNSLSLLVDRQHPERAIAFLRHQIAFPKAFVELDVFIWARILQNALSEGAGWLDVGDNDSPVWSQFSTWLMQEHGCLQSTACDASCTEIIALPLFVDGVHDNRFGSLNCDTFRLRVRKYPELPNTLPIELGDAVTLVMQPSLTEYFLHVLFPESAFVQEHDDLPADILLSLLLIQTPHVLATSRMGTSDDEVDADEEQAVLTPQGFVQPVRHKTPVARLLYCIRQYVGVMNEVCNVAGKTQGQHPHVIRATFDALSSIVTSPSFLPDTLAPSHRRKMLHALVRTFILDPSPNHDLIHRFSNGITNEVLNQILVVVFRNFPRLRGSIDLAVEILDGRIPVDVFGGPPNTLVVELYNQLMIRDWLDEFYDMLFASYHEPDIDTRIFLSYSFLVATYVTGLNSLRISSPSVYSATIDYLALPHHLLLLCKMIVLCDDDRREVLRDVSLIFSDQWATCLPELQRYFQSEEGRDLYNLYRGNFRRRLVPTYNSRLVEDLEYCPLEILVKQISGLSSNPDAVRSWKPDYRVSTSNPRFYYPLT